MPPFVYFCTTALLSISVWFLGTQISQHATWSNKELTGADWREFTPTAQCLPSSNKHALSCPYCVRSPCSPLCKHPPLYPITTIFRPRAGSDLIPNIRPSLPLSGGERSRQQKLPDQGGGDRKVGGLLPRCVRTALKHYNRNLCMLRRITNDWLKMLVPTVKRSLEGVPEGSKQKKEGDNLFSLHFNP